VNARTRFAINSTKSALALARAHAQLRRDRLGECLTHLDALTALPC
jgi:hypothetical protein